ncbi:DUF421 domain-containing protein [Pseudanabaenaceae cyanobacterium LEGE 13415]|nr:DUF421 domain-containing protein [Pseudanabaenaceae cyanobacterium LEGE 13415]
MHEFWSGIQWALGLGTQPEQLTFWQMALRAVIMFIAGIVMMRSLGDRRFSGRYSAFDVVLSITFGSLLSRAINGSGPFWATIGAGFVLVGMNRLLAFTAKQSPQFNQLVNGHALVLIQDGKIQTQNLDKAHMSQTELLSSLRRNSHLSDPKTVKMARFERNGQVSVIPAEREMQIVEVQVEAGVQTVRIQVDYGAGGQLT